MEESLSNLMQKEYKITQSQFEEIYFLTNMLENFADNIKGICDCERDDLKWIGFELGKMHSSLRNRLFETNELYNNIKNQNK